MADDEITMRRFTGKARRVPDDDGPSVGIYVQDGGGVTLNFNADARQQYLDGQKYIDYYLSEDGKRVGVKPVSGENVDGRSYKLSYNSASFGAIATEIGLSTEESVRAECEWDDDAGMLVFDLSGVLDDG